MNARDKRLWKDIKKALLALENPDGGLIFDDFDVRYREKERKRDKDSAAWFYRDKTPFETKYESDCVDGDEPAWVSDRGESAAVMCDTVSFDLDGDETAADGPNGTIVTDDLIRKRRAHAAIKFVTRHAKHCLTTLRGVLKFGKEREKTICSIMVANIKKRTYGSSRGRSTGATSTSFSPCSGGRKKGQAKKVSFFQSHPMFTGVKRIKKFSRKGIFMSVLPFLTP